VFPETVEVSDTTIDVNGVYIADFACKCNIPSTRKRRSTESEKSMAEGYRISVSNDGVTFSDEITYINYNSQCYDCDAINMTCVELVSFESVLHFKSNQHLYIIYGIYNRIQNNDIQSFGPL